MYTLYVKTGSIIKAGTDSKISITLGDASGKSVYIPDLEAVGLMGPGHDYFERANQDIFTVKAPCIGSPLCRINVTSDGSGAHHGWDCDYVEVTSTGPHIDCSQTIFYVQQWLALDTAPYSLTAVLDGCYDVEQTTTRISRRDGAASVLGGMRGALEVFREGRSGAASA